MVALKRVLYFVTEDVYFVSHRLALAQAALKAGYEVAVATQISAHQSHIEQAGLTVFPIAIERASLNPFSALKTLTQLYKAIKKFKPDILHLVAIKPVLFGNIAILGQPHITAINAFTGMGYLYSSPHFFHRVLRNLILVFFKFMFWKNKSEVIVQNGDDFRMFTKKSVVKPLHLHLIKGSGVNLDHYHPSSTDGTPIVALLVARALKDKGLREYIEAAKILKARQVPVILRFAGTPDSENPTSVTESELQDWHDQGLIDWKGYQSDIPTLWHDAHIAVLPSYREGLPKSLLEAAASGKPIISTDVPGCREICIHEYNGILVPAQNAVALADAIEKLVQNPELRQKMGAASRELIEQGLSLEAVNAATLKLYED